MWGMSPMLGSRCFLSKENGALTLQENEDDTQIRTIGDLKQ